MGKILKIKRKDSKHAESVKALKPVLNIIKIKDEKIDRLIDRINYLSERVEYLKGSRDFWSSSSLYWSNRTNSLMLKISNLEKQNGKSE